MVFNNWKLLLLFKIYWELYFKNTDNKPYHTSDKKYKCCGSKTQTHFIEHNFIFKACNFLSLIFLLFPEL